MVSPELVRERPDQRRRAGGEVIRSGRRGGRWSRREARGRGCWRRRAPVAPWWSAVASHRRLSLVTLTRLDATGRPLGGRRRRAGRRRLQVTRPSRALSGHDAVAEGIRYSASRGLCTTQARTRSGESPRAAARAVAMGVGHVARGAWSGSQVRLDVCQECFVHVAPRQKTWGDMDGAADSAARCPPATATARHRRPCEAQPQPQPPLRAARAPEAA